MQALFRSCCWGMATYLLLTFLWGESGVSELGRLARAQERLSQNIDELQRIGEELTDSFLVLKSGVEVVRQRARRLGFFREEEFLILPFWRENLTKEEISPGRLIPNYESSSSWEEPYRVIGLFVFLFTLALSVSSERKKT